MSAHGVSRVTTYHYPHTKAQSEATQKSTMSPLSVSRTSSNFYYQPDRMDREIHSH